MYEGFPGGSPEDLATEAANFFEDKNFNRDLVDILVLAVADALNLRIKIIRESPCGHIQVLIMEGQNPQFVIHLMFWSHAPPNNPNYVGANHYDAITTRKPVSFMQSCFLYWFPCGYLNNTWCPYGHHMASMWKPRGVLWKPHSMHF